MIHGVKYTEHAVVHVTSQDDHKKNYIYCKISSLYVCNDLKVFVTNILDTHHYLDHTIRGVSVYNTLGSCFSENCIYLIGAHSI